MINDIEYFFHVHVGDLYVFFGKVYIQIAVLKSDWIFSAIEFYEFFMYFGY